MELGGRPPAAFDSGGRCGSGSLLQGPSGVFRCQPENQPSAGTSQDPRTADPTEDGRVAQLLAGRIAFASPDPDPCSRFGGNPRAATMTRFSGQLRKIGRYCFYACMLFLLVLSGLVWYSTTESFQRLVRGRLITAIERATGGRAELSSFPGLPLRFQVLIRNLTTPPRQSAAAVPY